MYVILIEFEISEELKPIVSEFGYDKKGLIKITFTEIYQNIPLYCLFNINNNLQKSFAEFEERLKSKVDNLSPSHYNLIENDFINNLEKIDDATNNEKQRDDTNQRNNKTIYQRKYEYNLILYEAVIVERLPKFVFYNSGTFKLIDKIEVADYTIEPADTIISSNPIPYSFESEQELAEYTELAKEESFDSIFEKILSQFKDYVNIEEHNQVILSASILYSCFQDKFGTTHYNILVGENGSGKNSALLVFRTLGYRPLYVTAASAANYYTFLGQIQEGQGTIIEDEADNICNSPDKKNMLKTGYSTGGTVPKVGFTKNGKRFQEFYLTFCHKWFAMEELPQDKNNRGVFDRSFIHFFMKGEVKYNIKEVLKDKDSKLYRNLIHLRKLLFAFKLINYHRKFLTVKTNLKDRDAELTHPLLSIFYGGRNFEKIRLALSKIISEKTSSKSNSIESMIAETLSQLIRNENEQIIKLSNDAFYLKFKEVTEAKDYAFDESNSTFYLPDGTKISKYKIINLLKSKFKAKLFRTNQSRGFSINKKDIEKISKQYDVIEEIIVNEDQITESHLSDAINEYEKQITSEKKVTEVTEVTDFKDALHHSDNDIINQPGKDDGHSAKDGSKVDGEDITLSKEKNNVGRNNRHFNNSNLYRNNDNEYSKDNDPNEVNSEGSLHNHFTNLSTNSYSNITDNNSSNNKTKDEGTDIKYQLRQELLASEKPISNLFGSMTFKQSSENLGSTDTPSFSSNNLFLDQKTQLKEYQIVSKKIYTPLKGVTGVTPVTANLPKYPCFFCGIAYQTNVDFDMGNHFVEKHKSELNQVPITGNRETKIEWLISETKRRLREDTYNGQQENED